MKFYCVKERTSVELPEGKYTEYIPTDKAKAEGMKKKGRVGYLAVCEKCGTEMYTFRTVKKAVPLGDKAKI